jgi:hypothetical protein
MGLAAVRLAAQDARANELSSKGICASLDVDPTVLRLNRNDALRRCGSLSTGLSDAHFGCYANDVLGSR